MLPPYYFYWFRIDNKHMTKPWLDQALMDSAYGSDIFRGHKLNPTPPLSNFMHTHLTIYLNELRFCDMSKIFLIKLVDFKHESIIFKLILNSRPITNGVSWGPQKSYPIGSDVLTFFYTNKPGSQKTPKWVSGPQL